MSDDADDDDDDALLWDAEDEADSRSAAGEGPALAVHPALSSRLRGHAEAEAAFLAAYNSGKLPHAWLLAGPRGVGKATFAWRVAHFLLAEDRRDDHGLFGPRTPDSLDVPEGDPATTLILAGSHPGLMLLEREVKKSGALAAAIAVDQARDIPAFFTLKSNDDGWRVVIVDSADDLNRNAANALLKIIEEPPARALLLLVSHRPGMLLPTIRSRCRVQRFAPLSDDEVMATLADHQISPAERNVLVTLSEGSPGTALRFAGLEIVPLVEAIDAALAGQLDLASRMALAENLDGKRSEHRYEAFLDLAQRRLATAIRNRAAQGLSGEADFVLLDQLRALILPARALHDSPLQIVFQTLGLLAQLQQATAAA